MDITLFDMPLSLCKCEPRATSTETPVGIKDLLCIAAVALILRMLTMLLTFAMGHLSFEQYCGLFDSAVYLKVGDAIANNLSLSYHDQRVFPIYPLLIALVHNTGIPLAWSGLAISWSMSVIAAVLSAVVFRDKRIGWAIACFPSESLKISAIIMAETTLLAFILSSLELWKLKKPAYSGMLAAIAVMVKPLGITAVCGLIASALVEHDDKEVRKRLWTFTATFCLVLATILGLFLPLVLSKMSHVILEPLIRHEAILTWPGGSLVTTPMQKGAPFLTVAHKWVYMALAIAASVMAYRKLRSATTTEDRQMAVLTTTWLFLTLAAILCTSRPGAFFEVGRYLMCAAPAIYYAVARWLPKSAKIWILIGFLSTVIAADTAIRETYDGYQPPFSYLNLLSS